MLRGIESLIGAFDHSLDRIARLQRTYTNADRERYAIDEQHPHETIAFTVSIGVSALQPGDTVEEVVKRADQALYTAKHQGKNRAVSAA